MRHLTALALACWLVLSAAGAHAASERSAFLTRLTPSRPQPQAWKRNAAATAWRPVAAGDRFGEGDALRTAPGSRGELTFASGLSVRLLGEVELKLHSQGLNGTGLDLVRGKMVVLGAAAGSVQVTTYDAVTTARRAELLVDKTPKGTRLALLSGQASVMSDLRESVHEISTLEAGQQTLVPSSGPPADPYAVDPARLAAEAGLPIPSPSADAVVVIPASPTTTPEPEAVKPSALPAAPAPVAAAPTAAPSAVPLAPTAAPTPVTAAPIVAPSAVAVAPTAAPTPLAMVPSAAPTTAPAAPSPSAEVRVVPSAIPSSEPSPALLPSPEPSTVPSASPEVITMPSPSPNVVQSPSPVPSRSPTPRHSPAPRVAATPLPLPANPPSPQVAPGVLARMVVMKRQHRLYFFEPDGSLKKVYKIGLGAPGTPTPTGVRAVYEKLANPTGVAWALWPSSRGRAFGNRMLVLMWYDPVNQRFTYKSKQELHGTDVRVSVGGNMSHGCMRMLNEDIEEVYQNARRGDIIWVRDQ